MIVIERMKMTTLCTTHMAPMVGETFFFFFSSIIAVSLSVFFKENYQHRSQRGRFGNFRGYGGAGGNGGNYRYNNNNNNSFSNEYYEENYGIGSQSQQKFSNNGFESLSASASLDNLNGGSKGNGRSSKQQSNGVK